MKGAAFFLRVQHASAIVATMPNITLSEWAKRNGISRRKAEMLANKPGFPVVKERRSIKRTIWQKMVPDAFKLSDVSR